MTNVASLPRQQWFSTACTVLVIAAGPLDLDAQTDRLTNDYQITVVANADVDGARAFATGPDNALYVAVPSAKSIRVMPVDGQPSRGIPHPALEQRSYPWHLGWVDGVLWTMDATASVITMFDEDLAGVRSRVSLVLPGRLGEVRIRAPRAVLPGGAIVLETSASALALAMANDGFQRLPDGFPPMGIPSEPVRQLPVLLGSVDGEIRDTIAVIDMRNLLGFVITDGQYGEDLNLIEQPFADNSLLAVGPTGRRMVIVDRQLGARPAFRVSIVSTTGDTIAGRVFEYDPIRIAEEWVVEATRRVTSQFDTTLSAANVHLARAALFTPRWLPPVSTVFMGGDESVWLGREAIPGSATVRFERLDEQANVTAVVDIPSDLEVVAVSADRLWARRDQRDGSSLLKLRLSPHRSGRARSSVGYTSRATAK